MVSDLHTEQRPQGRQKQLQSGQGWCTKRRAFFFLALACWGRGSGSCPEENFSISISSELYSKAISEVSICMTSC